MDSVSKWRMALWSVRGVSIQARTLDEARWLGIGLLNGKCFSCVFTFRGNRVRLISARRSSEKEEQIYWEAVKHEETGEKGDFSQGF